MDEVLLIIPPKHTSLNDKQVERRKPNATAIAIVPGIRLLPFQPNPAVVEAGREAKGERQGAIFRTKHLPAQVNILEKCSIAGKAIATKAPKIGIRAGPTEPGALVKFKTIPKAVLHSNAGSENQIAVTVQVLVG